MQKILSAAPTENSTQATNMDVKPKPRVIRKKVTKDLPPPEVNETDLVPLEAFTDKKPNFRELVKKNLDDLNRISLKERTEDFINETSFTAIARVVKANTILKKIIWLILVIAAMAWLGLQCYWLFDKYFSYPVEVKVELKSAAKLAFPSVTVCNRNPLKKCKLGESVFAGLTDTFNLKTDDTLYNEAMDKLRDRTADQGSPSKYIFLLVTAKSDQALLEQCLYISLLIIHICSHHSEIWTLK